LLRELLDEAGLRAVVKELDVSRPMAGALLLPADFNPQVSLAEPPTPRFVWAASPRPSARSLLERLKFRAEITRKTDWGAHGYGIAGRMIWVWVHGKHAVFASDMRDLTGGWKLLRPKLARCGSGPRAIVVETDAARVSRMYFTAMRDLLSSIERRGSAERAVVSAIRSAAAVLGGIKHLKLQLGADVSSGLKLDLTVHPVAGTEVARWVKAMKPASPALLSALNRRGFMVSIDRSSGAARTAYGKLLTIGLGMGAWLIFDSHKALTRLSTGSKALLPLLSQLFATRGDHSAFVISMEQKGGLQGIWVTETSNPASHRKTLDQVLKVMPATIRGALSKGFIKTECSGKGCKKKKRRTRGRARAPRIRKRRARVSGVAVEVYRFPTMNPFYRSSQEMAVFDVLVTQPMSMAVCRVGKRTVVYWGGDWKQGLKPVIRALKSGGRVTKGLKPIQRIAAKALKGGVSSVTAIAGSSFLADWARRCTTELPKLAKKVDPTGRSFTARMLRRMGREIGSLASRWPAGGRILIRTRTVGGRFHWHAHINDREVQSVLFPFMLLIGRSVKSPPHPTPPVRVP
jgi:hypothetical protein